MIEIATDLFYVHPHSALQLIRKIAGPDAEGQSIDVLLTVLALSIEEEASVSDDSATTGTAPSISTKTIKSEIQDETLRSFVSAHSYTFSALLPSEIIAEAETLQEVTARLFLLRSWCNAHRDDSSAIEVVREAVHIISTVEIRDYSLPMLHLRQFAQPLSASEDEKTIRDLIAKMDQLKSTALKRPVEESVYYELVAAAIENKYSPSDAQTRLMDVYTEEVEEIEDLDLRCYCLARTLSLLPVVDPYNELDLISEVEEELILTYRILLSNSAEHYEISKRVLGVLVGCKPALAMDFSSQLNTQERRNKAYREMLRVYVTERTAGFDIDLIRNLLDLIDDPLFRQQTLVKILRASAVHKSISRVPELRNLFAEVGSFIDPVHQAFAYAYVLRLLSGKHDDQVAEFFQQMVASWSRIDTQWEKVEIGFNLVSLIAENNLELAKNMFDAVRQEKLKSPLSEVLVAELYINTLGLLIRAFSDSLKGSDYNEKLEELLSLIKEIPSGLVRCHLLGDLALRLYLGEKPARFEEIVDLYIQPELQNARDDRTYARMVIETAPCFYERDQEFYYDETLVSRLTNQQYDTLLAHLGEYVIAKQPLSNHVDLSKKGYKIRSLIDAQKVCRLIEHMDNDDLLYRTISTLADTLVERDPLRRGDEKGVLDERRLLDITKKLAEIIHSKLPNKKNIQHQGYLIACQSQLARLRDVATKRSGQWRGLVPSWEEIAKSIEQIPNAADRVLVLALVAISAHKHQSHLASALIKRAEDILGTPGQIPNLHDRQSRYIAVAESWAEIDNQQAAEQVLRDVWLIVNGLFWDETKDQVAGQILELAHSINPELAGSLANSVENPVARRTLTRDNTIKSLTKNPSSISIADPALDHQDLAYSASLIRTELCSGTGATIPERFVSEWIYRVADAPFREAHSVRSMAIQNQLIQKQRLSSPALNQVYDDLIDCLKLVYWIGDTLFADVTNNGYATEANVAVPNNLETHPIRSCEELVGTVNEWLILIGTP